MPQINEINEGQVEEKEYSYEFCKYVFTEDEKKEIAQEMARNVADLKSAEDGLKAVKSDFKSKIDGLMANVNGAANKLNNGYEMRSIKCEIYSNYESKLFQYIREDNGEIVKEKKMTSDDLQKEMFK